MSPYVTSAIIGSAVMIALQFVGLGFDDEMDAEAAPVAIVSVVHR